MTGFPVSVAGEALRALGAAAAIAGVLAAAEVWKRRASPPAEWTRKLVHVGVGLIAAGFPWIFASPWTVLALGVLFAAVAWATRRCGLLASVHGVARCSDGDFYYLAAIGALFLAGHHHRLFYLISVLVLALADSAAAVFGTAYGRRTYAVETDHRSLEGSAVFFAAAAASVAVPLLLAGYPAGVGLVIAVQLALLVTGLEAISLRGNDNLIVPLASYYLLVKMTRHSADWMLVQLAAQVAILTVTALAARRWRVLSFSAAVAAHLFLYAALALGGPAWVVPPLLALAGLLAGAAGRRGVEHRGPDGYQVAAVFYVTAVGLALLLLDNAFATLLPRPSWLRGEHPFFVLFVGAAAAHLGILLERRRVPLLAGGLRAAAVVIPVSLWLGPGGLTAGGIAVATAVCFGGLLLYASTWYTPGLRRQALCVALATLAVAPLHLWWRP